MTENTDDINTPQTEKTTPTKKHNPYEDMAQALDTKMRESFPIDPPHFRIMDPATILGRQMLALDDIFCEALDTFDENKRKPYNSAYTFMLPIILKIQQNCQSTGRAIGTIDYMEHLQRPQRPQNHAASHRPPLPPVPPMNKQTEFGDE